MEKKILLVDDDRDLAEIIRDMLKTYGYEVKIVESCEETFEILKKEQFSLMILDINLPDGTGFQRFRSYLPAHGQVKMIRSQDLRWAEMTIWQSRIR